MATCERCPSKATHVYDGMRVCASDYQTLAHADESNIPADYNWSAELAEREVTD